MANEEKQGGEEKSADSSAERKAIIFELEGLAADGHAALFDAVSGALDACGKELTTPLFSRFCISEPVSMFVPKLCGFLGISSKDQDKIEKQIKAAYENFWGAKDFAFRNGFQEFIQSAHESGLELIAVTSLPKKLAVASLKGLDSESGVIDIHSFSGRDSVVAGADTWMQVATDRGLNPRVCIGIASTGRACKAILAADLHCVVVPNEYTAYEDFSGARFQYDEIGSVNVGELVSEFYE